MITSIEQFPSDLLYRAYCQRGQCENWIKDLKNGLLADRLSCSKFNASFGSSVSCVDEPLGLTITDAARHLDVSRKTLSKILNGRGALTPEMVLRLEMAFGEPKAAHWIRLQSAYDLWQARQKTTDFHVTPVTAHAF